MAQPQTTWARPPPPRWEPPAQQVEPPVRQGAPPVQQVAPPPPKWQPPVQQGATLARQNESTTGRAWFWGAAGFSLAVWALSVTAVADDEWMIGSSATGRDGLKVADLEMFNLCDRGLSILDVTEMYMCGFYRGFTGAQIGATVICSIAVGLLSLAAFRPAVARCAPVKHLGIASGCLMLLYMVCQIAAVILAYLVVVNSNYLGNDSSDDYSLVDFETYNGHGVERKLGSTFWFGVAGIALALFTSVCLFVTAKHAGDGPFVCACC